MVADYSKSKLPPFTLLDEPKLAFNESGSEQDVNPLRGLDRYGAYSREVFPNYTPEIRLATMGPLSQWPRIKGLVTTLRSSHAAVDRREYVPKFSGFENVFGIPLVAASGNAHIKWDDELGNLAPGAPPHKQLSKALREGLDRLSLVRDQFDVVLVHLPEMWRAAFKAEGFDAHDEIKALGAAKGIPTQVINDRTFVFNYKASLAWRLSIALYVKAGGVPWKLGPLPGVPKQTAYIGLAYSLRNSSEGAKFVTCCSQVFDADGGGMQFVAYEAKDPHEDSPELRRNPYLTRSDMRAVMSRSLNLYRSRNGGALPQRLVVHKTTDYKQSEIEGVLDATSAVPEVECVEVNQSSAWRSVWLTENKGSGSPSKPDRFPVPRGTTLFKSGYSVLVWVAGNAPEASLERDYYQGKKSIPLPLKLVRHTGSGPLECTALEALALTKMDWNNDALYDPVPVTIRYSQTLAKTIANVPSLPGREYPYRLFM
ncbi:MULTISPECIES: nuclease PIN [unclassified Ruegeria]|uniref:argonaute/piwi family protein n=1 Tax=unclassified Ruegeria TaxID=2625375 RepID=UPI0014893F15|nr:MULTISPECIES: nuclease PIN [unclassified Ruegeria]